ncbi:Ribosomal protein L2 [Rhizoctonia solani]|uniref:Ribosomal protein L2 n=1 Tax=Rhizoctonia solani TaxID=456999 RepID=A0A8H7I5G4_9AGAM|nr:Ribosomal protein L2 [Rhizoctonia solani]
MLSRLSLSSLGRAFSTSAASLLKPNVPKTPPSTCQARKCWSRTRWESSGAIPWRRTQTTPTGDRLYAHDPGPHDVVRIEYDPGRSAHIALIKSRDSNSTQPWSYILACDGLRAGDVVESFRSGIPDGLIEGFTDSPPPTKRSLKLLANSSPSSPQTALATTPDASDLAAAVASTNLSLGVLRARTLKPGNVLPLLGRASLVRSAGTFAQVVAHDEKGLWTQVRLQSGEVRNIMQRCVATIGKVSNPDWKHRNLGKAGRSRWLGHRPHVRGVAMNACDHPHGGGRGKSKGGKHPRSVWGWLTKGRRTRRSSDRDGNKFVVKERPRGVQRNN